MANPFKIVDFTGREEILSSDLVRIGKLGSKALQDELLNAGLDQGGAFIASFSAVPSVTASGSFNETVGVGEALTFDASGVTADDSSLHVLQWPQQDLTFANPDPTNPRIDLIVALPASIDTDVQSRNILVDPVARTVTPANVAKTNSPVATLSVVTGTASGSPTPPAVPAGKLALFEVYVPAAAASSANFVVIQRLFRRLPYPFTGTNGTSPRAAESAVFRGCKVTYSGTTAFVSSSNNAVLIDGELIEFGSGPVVVNDSLNSPVAVAAPAGNDKPYYFYLIGGRNLPSAGATNNASPVELIASLTAPDTATGRPSGALGGTRGTTSSGCYVGIGFVRKSTTTPQICKVRGDFIFFASPTAADVAFEIQVGLAVADNAITLASAPSISDEVLVDFAVISGGPGAVSYRLPGMDLGNALSTVSFAASGPYNAGAQRMPISAGAGPHFQARITGAGTTANILATGYNMNVRRMG